MSGQSAESDVSRCSHMGPDVNNETRPAPEKDAGLTEAERESLAHAIEADLYRLSALNETGAPSAHWFGWFLMNKGSQHLVPAIESIIAARVTSPEGSDA